MNAEDLLQSDAINLDELASAAVAITMLGVWAELSATIPDGAEIVCVAGDMPVRVNRSHARVAADRLVQEIADLSKTGGDVVRDARIALQAGAMALLLRR